MNQVEFIKISKVKNNADNPRVLKDEKFKALVKSIQDFPEMLELRPIVVNEEMIALGGNQRLKACREAGLKEVPIIRAHGLTEAQQREFVVKDNTNAGEWDMQALLDEFGDTTLADWGMDFEDIELEEEKEKFVPSQKTDAPHYTPSDSKPKLSDMVNHEKTDKLIAKIEKADIPQEDKNFLKRAAQRHTVFIYEKIADYYAHSDKEIQELMEESALVLLDFKDAMKHGYVRMGEKLHKQMMEEWEDVR